MIQIESMKNFACENLATQCKRGVLFAPKFRLDACIAAMAWWMVGWGFAYGNVPQYGFIGREQCALFLF